MTPEEVIRLYDQTGKIFLHSKIPEPIDKKEQNFKDLWHEGVTEDIPCEIVEPLQIENKKTTL